MRRLHAGLLWPLRRISSNHSPMQARHPLLPNLVGMHLVQACPALRASSKLANTGSVLVYSLTFRSGLALAGALGSGT